MANGVTVLMVAEKPILAESIAKILSDGKCKTRKGWNGSCSVSEYFGTFKGQTARFKMTSTCGHVMGVDFPAKYNSWDSVDPVDLFLCPIEKKEANPKLKMPAYLASEAKGCDYLVLWLDCDKEGENICFEVIDAVRYSMRSRSNNYMDFIFRAKFSAISDREIKQAMSNLGKPNLNESLSVDARQELDLRIGCAFTRFQTKYFQNKYGDLDSTCISYGPCQTPTLAFCVNRHDQIVQFKPETYWVIRVEVNIPTTNRTLRLDWERERVFDRDVAQLFLNRIKSSISAAIVSKTMKNSHKEKPQALNTVEFLRVASSALGLSPTQAMSVAEHLYTRGYISYPRTETTAYPSSFDFHSILRQLNDTQRFGAYAKQIQTDGIVKPRSGEDKGDHPPITPMKSDDGYLSGAYKLDNARVYEYICQHFCATLMHNCKYKTEVVTFSISGETFLIQSKTLTDPGFTTVMAWHAIDNEESFEALNEGAQLLLNEATLVERETGPPGYLTESELITLMEKYGIGTDASIPVHCNNICVRNYVKIESGRRLVPTTLGIALIHGFFHVDHELIEATMRADVEKQLELIAKGKANFEAIKNHSLQLFKGKFMYYVNHVEQVDALFQGSFTTLAESGKPFSRCGKCRRFMKLIATKPHRLFCLNCQDTYSLPVILGPGGGGDIRLCGEQKCPIDDFDLLYIVGIGGKLAKAFAFCPHCFNYPPEVLQGMRKGVGCNECPHPGCPNSFMTQGVTPCLTECFEGQGVLVLDPMSNPKWRLTCNKCSAVVSLFEGAWKLKVLEADCLECGSRKLFVEFKKGKSKLPDGALTYTGCAFCDKDALGPDVVNLNHAYLLKNPDLTGRGGGETRGGRRRGRGRGRGGGRRG